MENLGKGEQLKLNKELLEKQLEELLQQEEAYNEEIRKIELQKTEEIRLEQEELQRQEQERLAREQEDALQSILPTEIDEFADLLNLHPDAGPAFEELPNPPPLVLEDIGRVVEASITGVLAKDQHKKNNRVSISSFQNNDWKCFLTEFRQFVAEVDTNVKYTNRRLKDLEATSRNNNALLESLNDKVNNIEAKLRAGKKHERGKSQDPGKWPR